MMLKIKDIRVDINRPKSLDDLKRFKDVCKTELENTLIEKPRKEFLMMVVTMIDKRMEKPILSC